MAEEESSEESVQIFEGALYTVQQRLDTFKGSYWPYETGTCTPLKMAEAGFYFCGSSSTPDWVRCIVCHHEMDGWEETDNPWEEHCAHSPNCYYLKKVTDPYKITVGTAIELEKEAIKCYLKKEGERLRNACYSYWEEIEASLIEAANSMS